MKIEWLFVEDVDRKTWSWRTLAADGTIERTSAPFRDYGEVVHDAIRHGFRPSSQRWLVSTRFGTSHFEPDHPPTLVPGDGMPSVRTPPDPARIREAAARRGSPPDKGEELADKGAQGKLPKGT